jgi:act minimal PKS acyl carrier protein
MAEQVMDDAFTLDSLREIMRACAGVDESVDLSGAIGDRSFADLGYDSLAVLETAAKVENALGILIPDDVAEKLTTPQSFVAYVNAQMAG